MKRLCNSVSMKKLAKKKWKNFDKLQHVENLDETSISFLLLDEGEVVQFFLPPT
jgi:hypothetical protein